MLLELNIRNIAIIDHLHVVFGPGLSVLTGETGAGKSIIIDALGLLLGGRARPELIRTGAEEASVEALFDLTQRAEVQQALAAGGFEGETELVVKRVVSRAGKNRIYLNGSLARVTQLEEIVGRLLAIYGQHEHQLLQRSEVHLQLLDRFAGLEEKTAAFRRLYQELAGARAQLRELESAEREREQRLDLLRFQQQEIGAAALREGEDDDLAAERLLLQNAGRLASVAEDGHETLYAAGDAVCGRIGAVAAGLEHLLACEPRFAPFAESLRACQYTLEDVAGQLRSYADRITFDPERQTQVEERLAQIALLKRKYAPTVREILLYLGTVEAEIARLSDLASGRDRLRQRIETLAGQLRSGGEILSVARRAGAQRLREAVERELKDLRMAKARFEVRLLPIPEPAAHGLENGEFYLAANPGEEAKPLASIASGGELSRIMLAIKRAAPEGAEISTLVFDEVDAGIGGGAATAVGEKLKGVAAAAQVLCITHLPQVAAFADTHFQVEKEEKGGRTLTRVVPLAGEERVREMARMLGGSLITDKTLAHAVEIIEASKTAGNGPLPTAGDEKG